MKRKNIKNDKVLRAITIGLATMIASTSAPVNVWAEDDGTYDTEDGNAEATAEEAAEKAAEETEKSVESASESVSDAIEMITDGGTVESVNENGETVTENIAPASPDDGGAQAEQAVAEFCVLAGVTETVPATVVTVTDPVTNETSTITQDQVLADLATLPEDFDVNAVIESEKTDTANGSGETTDNTGLSVAADIEIVEAELKNADKASKAADESAKEAAESVDSAADVVENAKSSVADAEAAAAPIITRIENATTADEVNAAFAELDKLTNDTKSDIDAKREAFNILKGKYEEAKKELTATEAEYDRAVGHAGAHVGYADKKLRDVQAYVDALSEACDKAKEKLGEEGKAAGTIKEKQDDVTKKVDWSTQKLLAKAIIDYYIIPQVLKGDHTIVEDIDKIRIGGFDTQNGNSYRFEYTDSNGESHTLYFNYDRTNRKVDPTNQWNNLGNAKEIIIYEKSEEEFRADEYLRKYYGKTANKLSYPEDDDYKKAVNRGDFAVYAYTDSNGNTQYICKAELEKSSDADAESKTLTYNNGKWTTTNNKLNISYDEESGKWSVNGSECRQIVQSVNTTSTGIKINVAEDQGLQNFLNNAGALVEKYNAYSDSIDEAQTAVDKAKEATGALKEQIDALDKGKDDKKIARLEEIQGLILEYDLMKYLSEEEQAAIFTENETSDMHLDPIGILDKVLENLEKDLKDAENDLSKLIEQRDEIAEQIAEVQEENNDGDEDDGTATDDETAADDGTSADDGTAADDGTSADDDDADAADDGAAAPSGFTFTGIPSYVTGTPAMTTLPSFGFTGDADGTGATGVLGVRTGGGNGAGGTEADEGGAAGSRTNVAPRADFGTVNKVLGSKQNKDNSQLVKKIKDNEIPLADIPNMDDEVKMNWWWLLIIFLLGATGKKMYDEHKKKVAAAEQAKAIRNKNE